MESKFEYLALVLNQLSDHPPIPSAQHATSFRDLAGPRSLPFFGNYFQLKFERLHQDLEQWADQYGSMYKVHFGPSPGVVISDTAAIQQILVNRPRGFRRGSRLELVADELQLNGVFAAEGTVWRRQRRLVVAALARAKLTDFFPQLMIIVNRLKRRWDNAADSGVSVNLCEDLYRFTVDVTMQIAFGVESNTLEASGPVIQQHLDKIFPKIHQRTNLPFTYWQYLKLPSDRQLDRSLVQIKRESEKIIQTTREQLRLNPQLKESPQNFLQALLVAIESESSEFTDGEIFANIGTILLAGEDTTANTMGWIIHYFASYPEYFARVRHEIDQVVGEHSLMENLSQAEQLPFLDAFRDEVMRLKPVAPLLVMESNEDIEILGVSIPKGTPLILLTRQIATSETNFFAAQDFRPERWMKASQDQSNPHDPRAFLPFGGGPRFCPGRNLAFLEMRVVLAMFCKHYDFELVEVSGAVQECLSFTMYPANLFIRLTHRR